MTRTDTHSLNAHQSPVIPIVAGPTASGKSAYALKLATEHNGVIINADSMQIYDALPTLTAQPGADDLARAPHRLYAVLPPAADCSAALWRDMALQEINDILAAGQTPIIVGGTGLYIRALTDGLSPMPDIPPHFRADTMARQETLGNPAFHEEFARRDPVMAARLHPQDTQRLIRAWEVFAATGQSLAHWQSLPPVPPSLPGYGMLRFHVHVYDLPRALLHQRCHDRFDQMLAGGALDEVAALDALIADGTVPDRALITKALGFAALRAYLHKDIDRDEARERTRAQTRQYIKRQCTWLRHQLRGDDDAPRGTITGFTVMSTPAA